MRRVTIGIWNEFVRVRPNDSSPEEGRRSDSAKDNSSRRCIGGFLSIYRFDRYTLYIGHADPDTSVIGHIEGTRTYANTAQSSAWADPDPADPSAPALGRPSSSA